MTVLAILRFFLGIPLGADIANGYTYVMEYMQRGKREVMGTGGSSCSPWGRSWPSA